MSKQVAGSMLMVTNIELVIPFPVQVDLKEGVSASMMVQMVGLTQMHLKVMVTYIEFVAVFLWIIPFPVHANLKEGVSALMLLVMSGLTRMHLRLMVTYIEFVVVFL